MAFRIMSEGQEASPPPTSNFGLQFAVSEDNTEQRAIGPYLKMTAMVQTQATAAPGMNSKVETRIRPTAFGIMSEGQEAVRQVQAAADFSSRYRKITQNREP